VLLAMPWRIWLCCISNVLRRYRTACAGAWREDDVPHRAELAKEVEEFLWGDVEAGES
jgi:hypothetical protein